MRFNIRLSHNDDGFQPIVQEDVPQDFKQYRTKDVQFPQYKMATRRFLRSLGIDLPENSNIDIDINIRNIGQRTAHE